MFHPSHDADAAVRACYRSYYIPEHHLLRISFPVICIFTIDWSQITTQILQRAVDSWFLDSRSTNLESREGKVVEYRTLTCNAEAYF